MEENKLNRIIGILREEMMTANPVGGQGGFGSNPTPASTEKTRAGVDPVIGKMQRRTKKKYIKLPAGSRKRWMKKDES